MPAALARSATRRPTFAAASRLPVGPARNSGSTVLAAASVRPARSSITWATMCRFDLNTASRGRSGVPSTFFRTRRCRRTRASALLLADIVIVSPPSAAAPLTGSLCTFVRSPSARSLCSLSCLALDDLAGIANALALVGLGLAHRPDVGRDLTDGLLVDPAHGDAGR